MNKLKTRKHGNKPKIRKIADRKSDRIVWIEFAVTETETSQQKWSDAVRRWWEANQSFVRKRSST
jgi:hypothetical protein